MAILLFCFSSETFAGQSNNETDAEGRKQGYWVVKGFMVNAEGYAADALVEEGNYKDDRKEGNWKAYYTNGKCKSEIAYTLGRPNGAYKLFYLNGALEEQGSWTRNKNVGAFNRFYENGKPQQEFFFAENGRRNGEQKYYYENGQLWLEVNVENGKENGKMTRFYPDGMLKETKILNDGVVDESTVKTFKPRIDTPVQPAVEAKPKPQDIADEPAETNAADIFRPNGPNTLYNKNHQVSQSGDFKNGKLWGGKYYRYNKDGLLLRIEIYIGGEYVGNGVIEDER